MTATFYVGDHLGGERTVTPLVVTVRQGKTGMFYADCPPGRASGGGGGYIARDHTFGTAVTTLGFTDCGCEHAPLTSTSGESGTTTRDAMPVGSYPSDSSYRPGLVLDPFAGSGTTLAVATGHGRDAIGIDLDARNFDLALDRVGQLVLQRGDL